MVEVASQVTPTPGCICQWCRYLDRCDQETSAPVVLCLIHAQLLMVCPPFISPKVAPNVVPSLRLSAH